MALLGELVEIIAFAGLGHREFHEVTGRYCSYAQFQLIIQSFKDAPEATWTTRRRRDRYLDALVSRGTVQVKSQETESLPSAISPEMALRLAKTLGRSPESWLALQHNYDLWQARQRVNLAGVSRLTFAAV